MGALERVERSGAAQLSGIRVRAPSGAVIAGDFVASHGFRGFRDRGLSVRREVRDASRRVVGVQTLTDGASREIRARLVIAADGLRSVIARRLGLAHALRWPRRLALVTHYAGVTEIGEHGEMHVERDGYVGIADVGNGITTVALVVPTSRARDLSHDRAAFLDHWLRARPHLAPRFAGAERVSPVVATGPFASHARRAWSPGVALVGDAADFFDPFTGEGIYAALRGGEMLAESVRESLAATSPSASDAPLAAYDAARRREFGGKWLVERVIGAVVGSAPLINRE